LGYKWVTKSSDLNPVQAPGLVARDQASQIMHHVPRPNAQGPGHMFRWLGRIGRRKSLPLTSGRHTAVAQRQQFINEALIELISDAGMIRLIPQVYDFVRIVIEIV